MRRIYTLTLTLVLGALLIPQHWVSFGAPNVSGSMFRLVAEPQRQAPPERLVGLNELDSLPLADTGDSPLGRDPRRWRQLLTSKINQRFQEVFPGVDLVFAGNSKRLEAVLIVKPGVDPASIRFDFPQVEAVAADAQANIWVAMPGGDLGFLRPLLSRQNEKVSGSFAVQESRVVLQVQDHDASQPLLVRFDVVFPERPVNLLDQILYRTLKAENYQPTSPASPEQTTTVTATKTVNQATVSPGGTLMYTVTIANTGATTANGVQFTDTISNNTTLVGGSVNSSPIGTNDTYTATGNIPIAPSSGVLSNDVDPDTGNNTGLTVTQVQGSGANVGVSTNTTSAGFGGVTGSVTVQSNGSFTYEPPPGFTGSDTFTYRVADAGGKFDDATVTINITNVVWFINNNSPGSLNRGTFTHPFTNIANFNTANTGAALRPAAGHIIALRTGSGTYSEADGINLLNNQILIGEAVALNTVFTADANSTAAYTTFATATMTAPVITTSAGNGVDLASGNTVRGLNIGNTPGFFGFNGGAVGALTIGTVSVTGTGGAINISTSGAFGSTVNFGTLESTSTPTNNINLVGVTGTMGVASGGAGLSGTPGNQANVNINGGSVSTSYPGSVTKSNAGPMVNVLGGHTGTVTFTGTLTATNGSGLQFNDAAGTYNFNGTTTLSGGAVVNITNGSGGIFSFGTGTSITAGNDVAVTIDGGTATFTYSGSITKTGSGDAVRVQNGHATGIVTFQTGTLSITGGNGLQFDNADSTYNFNGTATLNGGDAAIDIINGSAGNFTFSANTSVTNPSGTAFRVDGANGTITYNGTLSKTSTSGRLIDIMNRTGGSVSFTNTLTSSGSGATGILVQNNTSGSPNFTFSGATKTLSTSTSTAVTLSNNATSTINFSNGGLDIDTTSGTGFSASSSGIVSVTTGANPNTIDSTTGTALNVTSTTIGASGLTFRSISSNGASSGIVLNTTGASGSLTVSGNGGSCTSTASCTGGAIQNSTGHAISLTSTTSPSFTRIAIQNAARSGIDGQQVTNFTLANSFIDNVGTGAVGQYDESNISFNDNGLFTSTNLSGTVSITNNTLTNARRHGIQIENGSGTISNLTISNNTLTSSTNAAVSLGSAILALIQGSASLTAHLTTGTISGNIITNFPSGEGIAILGGSGNASNNTSSTLGANGTPINITNNTISGQAAAASHLGSNAIRASMNSQTGVMNFNISCNGSTTGGCTATGPITNIQGQGISVFAGGSITGSTTIDKNVIVANQTLGAGTQGLAVQVDDGPAALGMSAADYNTIITNNSVSNYEGNGIRAIARASLGKLDVTIQNNTVGTPILANRNGIRVDSGSAAGDVTLCMLMTGNTSAGSGVNAGIGIRKQGIVATTNDFGIVGLAPSPTTAANAQAKVVSDNPAGGGVDVISGDNFVNCGVTPFRQPVETLQQGQSGQSAWIEPSRNGKADSQFDFSFVFAIPKTPADYLKFSDKPVSATALTELRSQTAPPVEGGGSRRIIGQLMRPVLSAYAISMGYVNPLRLFEQPAGAALVETASAKPAEENKAKQPAKLSAQQRPQRTQRTEGRTEAPQRQQPKPPTRILTSPEFGETVMVGPFNLPPGESVQIMFSVTVTGTTGCTISNQAAVSGTNFSSVTTNAAVTTILQAPSAITCPSNIVGTTDPGQCTSVKTFTTPTTSAGCPVPTVTCTPASGFAFPVGTTTVTCTATNSQGSTSCTFTVTITDAQAPTLSCPAPITANTAPGICTATVTYTTTIMDNCPGATFSCAPASGSTFAKGVTTVTCTGMDASGNPAAPCSFTVTVVDNQNPVIGACPTNITQPAANGQCSATVTYTAPTATDNCGAAPVVCAPASGSTFNVGTTTVTCTATDTSNNTANCMFTVTIQDTQNPTIACPTNQTVSSNVPIAVNYPPPTASDNCPGVMTNCVPASGSTFAVGTTTVTCTATDASNNTANCMFTVSVVPCTVTCPTNQSAAAAAGQCSAVVNYPAPTTTGTCGTVTCIPASGSSFAVGVTTVTCTAAVGPSCMFTVTVTDTQLPTLTCPANIIANTAPGTCAAMVTYTTPTASDNCPGATVTCTPASGTSFAKGVTTVTCTAKDASNNMAMCTFTVTVNDNIPPAITCPANIALNTAAGQCSAVATYTTPTPTDNCPGATAACVPASGSTFQKGVTTVTCTATDASSNTAACTFTVTVTDNIAPTLTCPANISTNATTGQCSAAVTYTVPTASDNCPGATVACVPNTGSSFTVGTTTVTCTATDTSNNTAACTFTVTVTDTQLPTLTCPANITANTGAGTCAATVTYTTPTASDNCPNPTVTCLPASGTSFAKGVTTVTCTAKDASNNMAMCTFTVTVNDNIPPAITCPANISLNTAAGQCSAVATYTTPTPTDNCPGATAACVPASGSTFQKGVTTVTCTATDASNNTATCTFTVTVTDNIAPTLTCPANISLNTAAGQCSAVATYTTPTPTDNCPGATAACVPASGSTFQKGVTTVTCTATDASNNTAACTFTVTVTDNQNPTITCPANQMATSPGGPIAVTYPAPTATDNCPGVTTSCTPASGSTFPLGTTTVNCTATDASARTASCSFTVTVITCTSITCPTDIFVGTTGNSTTVTYSLPTANGNCGTITCSPASGSTFNVGTTTVSCASSIGNQTCAFKVTVNRVSGTVSDPLACTGPGNTVQATLVITNNGNVNQNVADATTFTNLVGVPNSCTASPNVGTCTVTNGGLTYNGTLTPGQTVTLTYLTQVSDLALAGTQICTNNSVAFNGGTAFAFSACGTVNCPAPGPGLPFPARSEASDQATGSVLIYNIYTSSPSAPNSQNTRVALTNTHPVLPATVHLFFVDGTTCSIADSYVCLTANQTSSFLMSDLDPGTTGYIVAVATNSLGCPINFNYLIGDEYVKFQSGHAANLGAQAFSAIPGGLVSCDQNSVTATINFDGVSYDRTPRTLALDSIGARADGNDTLLILNRIGGNLGIGANTLSTIFGIFYDDSENSVSFSVTGACQLRSSISNNFPRTTPRFEQFIPAGRTGWMKLFSQSDIGITGSAINFNPNASSSAGAFNQGHNLHSLTLSGAASYVVPVFPPSC